MTRDWLPEPLKEAELVMGATLLGGLYDLGPLRSTYIGDAIGLTAAESARNSLIRNVHNDLPPSVIAHGGDETRAFTEVAVPGHDHFDLPFGLGDPRHPLGAAVERMMRR